jgi:hypothetical protein
VRGTAAFLLASLLVLSASPRIAGAGPQAAPFQDRPPAISDPTEGPFRTDNGLPWVLRLEHHSLLTAVVCVVMAWNAYDADAARKCYHQSAVAVWSGQRKPIDWEFERRLREFDAAVRSQFRFEILDAQHPNVEFTLYETNRLLDALGLKRATARWRYTVRDSQIVEEQLVKGDEGFNATLRDFTRWAREQRPQGWALVSDGKGNVRFDGASAPALIALAQEWSRSQGATK